MVKMTGGGCQKSIPIERITIPTVFKIGGFFADKLYIHGLLGATFVTLSLLYQTKSKVRATPKVNQRFSLGLLKLGWV